MKLEKETVRKKMEKKKKQKKTEGNVSLSPDLSQVWRIYTARQEASILRPDK